MESRILNTYHQARYRTIGHKILRTTSESLSSEGSCTQNSPEYTEARAEYRQYGEAKEGEYWRKTQDWSRNQTINMTRSQESSSDEEENIEVQEVSFDERATDHLILETESVEDNTLVEGDDYDVIQVYAVDPDLDLEASSDDEEQDDFCIQDKTDSDTGEYLNPEENIKVENYRTQDALFNLDTAVVSNVDEYFIKEDKDKDILAVKDEPVVRDVDEYFIKKDKVTPNVDDFFIKEKVEDTFDVPKTVNVDSFFVESNPKVVQIEPEPPQAIVEPKQVEAAIEPDPVAELPINESDLEVLPNIEELKRFLLEDMTYTKFKNSQRSCSLPQSPMHNLCLDIDDAKTCLSFEDLNLDLSDLTFDNEKDKSGSSGKSDDIPRALTDEDVNSFLITNEPHKKVAVKNDDDFSHQDMEIDRPVESIVSSLNTSSIEIPDRKCTSTPIPKPTVFDFCIEKTPVKKVKSNIKIEAEDFVDVESCNETVIPVLEANNLNSLLEQFEATEKLNTKPKRPVVIKAEEPKVKPVSLTNGMRLQDAGVQLNKNKMRQILMPSTINTTARRSPSPVHSDHDYCSSKKRYSLPNIKGGQSLLKPEVLSSNSRILNSRHRSCKNKKVVYNLSSDDESEKNNGKNKKPVNNREETELKLKKPSVKQTVKVITPLNTRKKLSPVHCASNDTLNDKSNSSVIVKDACKASDTPCSQNSNGSIKLTIKNKSEVILNCDDKDSQKDKYIEKCKSSNVSDKTVKIEKVDVLNNNKNKKTKIIKELDSNKNKSVSENCTNVTLKEESRPKAEHFYTALFSNKQDVQVPQALHVKSEKRSFEEEISIATKSETEQPQKRKKLNLQEYKLRKVASSNNNSATVSPEAIFPDMPIPLNIDKIPKIIPNRPPNGTSNTPEQAIPEAPKVLFDPIREASRKILMNTKKLKAQAMRKRDEDIVMSKIPKVENLELQPLISDAEMMKIVGMAPAEALPVPILNEKPLLSAEYEEIVMFSVGTNTDDTVFKELEMEKPSIKKSAKSPSPVDSKLINFKIKKSDHVLKQNVFDAVKRDKKSPVDDKRADAKIDRERYKDITATLKSVGKQVDRKIVGNSLFSSIQDVVLKKAPDENTSECDEKRSKSNSPKRQAINTVKTVLVRDYDTNAEHGEDKIILHLGKDRSKPDLSTIVVQTDPSPEYSELILAPIERRSPNRKRNDSDMSMSSEGSPVRAKNDSPPEKSKAKSERRELRRSVSTEKRSRSRERYDKFRRSRSRSRSRRRRRSRSRSRSRSRCRYRKYRRSDSPYRRKRRSRSPYRGRRSPSPRREYRAHRSRSRNTDPTRSKSPVAKKNSPQHNGADRKVAKSLTPPPRKPTVSESSSDSSSSSSSSSSSGSSASGESRPTSPYRREEYRAKGYRSPNQSRYSSEDRESNTPVEERRIVFVGKLEQDITKSHLRAQFCKFGSVIEVRLHSKEDGSRYGFVTYQRARDAWSAVEAAAAFPQYDVGFGGRRAFCRQTYADLDGLEAKYTESAFHGAAAPPPARRAAMSFEQMLHDMRQKLSQRKTDKQLGEP